MMNISELLNLFFMVEESLWQFVGAPVLIITSLYFSYKSKFFQIRGLVGSLKSFFHSSKSAKEVFEYIQAFFASTGAAVGVGNVAGVCLALKFGGPGSIFWIWAAGGLGILLKYCEVFLGVKFGIKKNGFLAYVSKVMPRPIVNFAAILVCFYGIEVYQFNVVKGSISYLSGCSELFASIALLILLMFSVSGGFKRIGTISALIIPPLCFSYLLLAVYIIFLNYSNLTSAFYQIFSSAFSTHAAVGGFLGSSFINTLGAGIARGCYATDIGTGYSSIVYAKSGIKEPQKAASLVLMEPFFDVFGVCTLSLLIVLVTGTWTLDISADSMVESAMSHYIPFSKTFFNVFMIVLGFSTIITFFRAGIECAQYLGGDKGVRYYFLSGAITFLMFSFIPADLVLSFMSMCGLFILLINVFSILVLRKEIEFD